MRAQVRERKLPQARDRPRGGAQRSVVNNAGKPLRSLVWFTDAGSYDNLTCRDYTTLAACPEVVTAVNTIARLIGSMTIYLMRNLPQGGDVRIINDLSRVVDIEPNAWMNRSNFVQWIVRTLYLEGNGNAVVWPRTQTGKLQQLIPVPASYAAFVPDGLWDGYRIAINGAEFNPDQVLHFSLNPGSYYPWQGDGFTLSLTTVANTLKQAAATEKGFAM